MHAAVTWCVQCWQYWRYAGYVCVRVCVCAHECSCVRWHTPAQNCDYVSVRKGRRGVLCSAHVHEGEKRQWKAIWLLVSMSVKKRRGLLKQFQFSHTWKKNDNSVHLCCYLFKMCFIPPFSQLKVTLVSNTSKKKKDAQVIRWRELRHKDEILKMLISKEVQN